MQLGASGRGSDVEEWFVVHACVCAGACASMVSGQGLAQSQNQRQEQGQGMGQWQAQGQGQALSEAQQLRMNRVCKWLTLTQKLMHCMTQTHHQVPHKAVVVRGTRAMVSCNGHNWSLAK